MAPEPVPIRLLCLGNELVSDDALGIVAARRIAARLALEGSPVPMPAFDPALTSWAFDVPGVGAVEVLATALAGMYLLDAVTGASRLIVVDTVVTGAAEPGTILELTDRDFDGPGGAAPHGIGLPDALALARALGMPVARDVLIVAVEAGDGVTIGGAMTPPVEAALDVVVERAIALVLGSGGAAEARPMIQ